MKHIEGTAPHRLRVFAADLAGTSERRAPQDIGLHIAAFGHILVKSKEASASVNASVLMARRKAARQMPLMISNEALPQTVEHVVSKAETWARSEAGPR